MAKTTSMFASLEGLPTEMGNGEVFKKLKPFSTGVSLPATDNDREFKKKYDEERMVVDTKGFTVFVSMPISELDGLFYTEGSKTPPMTYFRFKIGETPTYSFYFGDSAPSFPLLATNVLVESIVIDRKKDSLTVNFGEAIPSFNIVKGKMKWAYADELATNGYFYSPRDSGYDASLVGIAPYNQVNAKMFRDNASELNEIIPQLIKGGEGLYLWNADKAKAHYGAQSFTFDSTLDKEFLLPAKVDFSNIDALDTKNSYVSFSISVENKAKRTNNYTGRHSGDSSYLVNLQFPGDEELLAPMGVGEDGTTVACGMESPAGRVLKSITPVMKGGDVEQVKLEFRDGSNYIFPDAETGLFTATDKQFPDQMLEGKVMNMIVGIGSPKEQHAVEVATRLEQDVDISKTVMIDGKSQTKAIAWRTMNPSTLKVIVPNPDGKGSKLITIPLTKEA